MSKKLKCDLCDKDASVHLTQIVNGKIHKVDLCDSCAQQKGVTDPEGFSLADMLTKASPTISSDKVQMKCSGCGLDAEGFRRKGRFGCGECYTVFRPMLIPLLRDMHEGLSHKGKVPEVALSRQSSLIRIKKLQASLAKAIAEEAYEEAAGYRDQIRAIQDSDDLEVSLK